MARPFVMTDDVTGKLPDVVEARLNATYALIGSVGGGGQAARRQALSDLCNYGAGSWFVQRVSAADYRLIRDLGDGNYLTQKLAQVGSLPGGFLVHQLGLTAVGSPMLSVDDGTATYVGTFVHGIGASVGEGYKSRALTGGAITAASTVLTVSGGDFTAGDVGRRVVVTGAGAAGADLQATITVFTSATQVTVGASAGTTVAGAAVTVWPGYHYSTTAGDTATWVSPAGSTSLGIHICTTTVAGLAKVSIDGSTTAANLLPTAQSKVDSGAYAATILVANGGTLNPTDRVLDGYSTTALWDAPVAVASNLTAAAHTVVMTATGYTHVGGSGGRAYVTAFSYGTGIETPTTAGAIIAQTQSLNNTQSAFEYAYSVKPTGATTSTLIGSVHGWEIQDALTLVIDGLPVTMTDGQTLSVSSYAEFRRLTHLRHPDTGATTIATIATNYRMDSGGLTVRHVDKWVVGGTSDYAYPVMFPVSNAVFDSAQFDSRADVYNTFTGSSQHVPGLAGEQATAVALWSSTGPLACAVLMPTAKAMTGNWASTYEAWIEDRAPIGGDKINKVYLSRVGAGIQTITDGEVWDSQFTLIWARFAAGAAKVLPVA